LNRKAAECQALKAELDESFALILSLLADETRQDSKTKAKDLESELARLQEAIYKSEALSFQQDQQLVELQAEIMQNTLDLAATQQEAKLELDALSAEHETLDAAARSVIERAGAASVPALIDLLTDQSVEIRKWAAQCLGTIGPDAAEAQAPLQDLLSDPEPAVRTAAQRAIASIMGNELD
jgi:HEAT repeat protein